MLTTSYGDRWRDASRLFQYDWVTLRSIKYNLITSDGIQRLEKSGLELYLTPFQTSVWLLLLLSLLATLMFVSVIVSISG